MTGNAANVRWADVSDKIKRELESARLELENAPIEEVPKLQGQVIALRSIIDWFERGALAERAVLFSPYPHEQQD